MAGETVLGALRYDFTADTSGLKSGLSEVTNSVKRVTDQLRGSSHQFEQMGRASAQSVGLARHEMLNLTRQLNDVGVSLAGGMSPFMVLIQQGGQIADIFQGSSASASQAIRQLLFNSKTAAIGIAAAIGGIAAAAISSELALEKLFDAAKALGTNRTALKEFNRQADIIGVDPAKMNEELVGLAQKLREAQIAGGDLADKLAGVGINIKNFDLSKPGEFARLFEQIGDKVRNGSNELDKLNALKFLGLSTEFNRLFTDGSQAISRFVEQSQGAAEKATKPLEKKFEELRRIVSDTTKYITEKATEIAYAVVSAVTEGIESIISLIDSAKRKWAEFKAFVSGNDTTKAGVAAEMNSKMARAKEDGVFPPEYFMPVLNPNKTAEKAKAAAGVDLSSFSKEKDKAAKGSSKAATDQIKTYIDGLREAASISQSELDNWSKGNIEREKAMALVKAENIAKQEGRTLTAAQREEILSLAGQQEIAKQKVDELKYSQDRLNDAMQEFGDQVARSLEDLIIRGQKASEVLRQLISQLASAALRGMLTGEGMFGKLFGMAGDKEGGLGGILGKAISFMPKFAAGGTLGAGRWGIAGEAGPELVKGPAHITPFGKMGQQGAKVTVNNYSGAPVQARQMSDGEILVVVGNMIQSNNRRVPGLVADAQRRSL